MPIVMIRINGQDGIGIELDRFKERLDDIEPVWEAVADRMAELWGREFRLQGAYQRWSPLSPRYRKWKAKRHPGKKTLHLTGDLRDSMTRRPFGVEAIEGNKMVIGTQVFYANYHQRGTANMPARPIIKKLRREESKLFAKYLHGYIINGRVGRGTSGQ
jgi:phage gpG-like protein